MDDTDGFDRSRFILVECLCQRLSIDAMTPIRGKHGCLQREFLRKTAPGRGKVPGFVDEDIIVGGKTVNQCCFPGAGARRGKSDYGTAGFENQR